MEDQDEKQSFEFVEEVAKSILNVHLVNLVKVQCNSR